MDEKKNISIKFAWDDKKHRFSRWLRGRTKENNIEAFAMEDCSLALGIDSSEIRKIINYWRIHSRDLWDYLHKDTENTCRDWEGFLYNLNQNHEVYFLVSEYIPSECRYVWFQPDFRSKEERDNKLLDREIKGMFTRIGEMAMMGETVTATNLPATQVLDALKSYDQKYIRDGDPLENPVALLEERIRVYTCPACHTGKMFQKRNGDWKCRECHTNYSEDEFSKLIREAVEEKVVPKTGKVSE